MTLKGRIQTFRLFQRTPELFQKQFRFLTVETVSLPLHPLGVLLQFPFVREG